MKSGNSVTKGFINHEVGHSVSGGNGNSGFVARHILLRHQPISLQYEDSSDGSSLGFTTAPGSQASSWVFQEEPSSQYSKSGNALPACPLCIATHLPLGTDRLKGIKATLSEIQACEAIVSMTMPSLCPHRLCHQIGKQHRAGGTKGLKRNFSILSKPF